MGANNYQVGNYLHWKLSPTPAANTFCRNKFLKVYYRAISWLLSKLSSKISLVQNPVHHLQNNNTIIVLASSATGSSLELVASEENHLFHGAKIVCGNQFTKSLLSDDKLHYQLKVKHWREKGEGMREWGKKREKK